MVCVVQAGHPVRRGLRFGIFLALGTAACGPTRPWDLVVRARTPSEAADGGAAAVMPWGTYAATLNVPACPAMNPLLRVDTALDELDSVAIDAPEQAGEHLSLREALWIAHNRLGPDTISFDETVFPVDPPTTILMTKLDGLLPNALPETCLDGRDRGVVIDWPDGTPQVMWPVGPGSLQIGLTFLRMPGEQFVQAGWVAGCRFTTDGWQTVKPHRLYAVMTASHGARIGPENVFSNRAPVIVAAVTATISDNWFGFDPLTRRRLGPSPIQTFHINAGGKIKYNHFTQVIFRSTFDPGTDTLFFEYNHIGVDQQGRLLRDDSPESAAPSIGVSGLTAPSLVGIGPSNVIRGQAIAILVDDARVTITQNNISGNDAGIKFVGSAPIAPSISSATRTLVKGTCAAPGFVELYADEGNQGRIFVGLVQCEASGAWSFSENLARAYGLNVTATQTDAAGRTSGFSAPVHLP